MVKKPEWLANLTRPKPIPSIYSYARGNPEGISTVSEGGETQLLGHKFPMWPLAKAARAEILAEYPSATFEPNHAQPKPCPEMLVLHGTEAERFSDARLEYIQRQRGFSPTQKGQSLVSKEVIALIAGHTASYHSSHDSGSRQSTMTLKPAEGLAEALEQLKTHYGANVVIEAVNEAGLTPVQLRAAPAELVHAVKQTSMDVATHQSR